jgi:demethylmenaquinone methyltransferase/2-methoxy-6-polyprenyl-1,4-benzoquinol methylase
LLDAGGGTGRIAGSLAGQAGQIIVADESCKMLSRARAKPGLRLAAAHAERLPFTAGTFDRVIMVDAYHHLRDQDRSLAELLRVCAPGGLVVLEEPDIERVGVWAMALFERLALMRSRFRRAEEIASGLRALGADVSIHRQATTAWIVARVSSRE